MLADLKERSKNADDPGALPKGERKGLKKVYRRGLVKRSQLMRIAAAWVITVPASARDGRGAVLHDPRDDAALSDACAIPEAVA